MGEVGTAEVYGGMGVTRGWHTGDRETVDRGIQYRQINAIGF